MRVFFEILRAQFENLTRVFGLICQKLINRAIFAFLHLPKTKKNRNEQ
jgi:hypothetical protein